MNQDMKVSILVPFFKVEQYVGRCVESLFTQTYKNIEYIFVNDCSPDKSMEVINSMIDKYDMASKCKIIVHENNLGISASRNDCLDNMTGDYFLFIDSDDYIDKDMVEMLVEAALKENADISGCGYIEEYADHSVEHPQKYTNDHNEMMRAITLLTIKGVMWKLLVRSTIVTAKKCDLSQIGIWWMIICSVVRLFTMHSVLLELIVVCIIGYNIILTIIHIQLFLLLRARLQRFVRQRIFIVKKGFTKW